MNPDVAFAAILGLASALAAAVFALTWFGSRKSEEAARAAGSNERVLVDLDKVIEELTRRAKRDNGPPPGAPFSGGPPDHGRVPPMSAGQRQPLRKEEQPT